MKEEREAWVGLSRHWIGLAIHAHCACPYWQNVYSVTEGNEVSHKTREKIQYGEPCYASEHGGEGYAAFISLYTVHRQKADEADQESKRESP